MGCFAAHRQFKQGVNSRIEVSRQQPGAGWLLHAANSYRMAALKNWQYVGDYAYAHGTVRLCTGCQAQGARICRLVARFDLDGTGLTNVFMLDKVVQGPLNSLTGNLDRCVALTGGDVQTIIRDGIYPELAISRGVRRLQCLISQSVDQRPKRAIDLSNRVHESFAFLCRGLHQLSMGSGFSVISVWRHLA